MFRALTCPSSGGQIVFSQHLVSSLSVNGCTINRLRADLCPSSGGQIVFSQHLVSSLSVNGCTINRLRAGLCPSSGGQIVFSQHLVSSLSVNDCTLHRLRALNRSTVQPFTESDDTRCCVYKIGPPEDGHVNARNMSRIVV